MRRRVRGVDAIPEHLLVFRSSDWPADSSEEAFLLWRAARHEWADVRGWPGGPLALLAGESDVRAVLEHGHLWSWGRTTKEMEAAADELGRGYGYQPRLQVGRRNHVAIPRPTSSRRVLK